MVCFKNLKAVFSIMPKQNSSEQEVENPFASFVDILREMVSAGYGFQDIFFTLKDLGLTEEEARTLIELNVEKQLPVASGKIEAIVKERIERHVEALRKKIKRRVESKKRRVSKGLERLHNEVLKVVESEAPEKQSVFEKRYYNYVLLLNQVEIEHKELLAFLLELKALKLSRKSRSKVLHAISVLQNQ